VLLVSAALASAHGYNSEKAGVSAKGESKFFFPKMDVKCTETTYEWTLVGKATTLPTTPKYGSCTLTGGVFKNLPVTIVAECKGGFVFDEPENVEGEPIKAKDKVTISKGCKIVVKFKELVLCEIKIVGEQLLERAHWKILKAKAGGFESSLEIGLTGITYSTTTFAACETFGLTASTGKNGEFIQGPTSINGVIIE
jgi:hypothetical protein